MHSSTSPRPRHLSKDDLQDCSWMWRKGSGVPHFPQLVWCQDSGQVLLRQLFNILCFLLCIDYAPLSRTRGRWDEQDAASLRRIMAAQARGVKAHHHNPWDSGEGSITPDRSIWKSACMIVVSSSYSHPFERRSVGGKKLEEKIATEIVQRVLSRDTHLTALL
jgi:hypothetical protein